MSILFATPCYGGKIDEPCHRSYIQLIEALIKLGIDYQMLTLKNESLITRGRNHCVAEFMKTDFERMMFIDADIEFKVHDVLKLLDLDVPLAVGVYPMKRPGAPYAAWVSGELVTDLDRYRGPIEVDYAGTGFMMIHRNVIRKMMARYPETECADEGFFALFDCEPCEGVYLSEDYLFCKRYRDIGGKVVMDPSVRLIHHGAFAYGRDDVKSCDWSRLSSSVRRTG